MPVFMKKRASRNSEMCLYKATPSFDVEDFNEQQTWVEIPQNRESFHSFP